MGAIEFVCTNEEDWFKPYAFKFDFILNTADQIQKFNLPNYFSILKVWGKFHCVGFGDHPLPTLNAQGTTSVHQDFARNSLLTLVIYADFAPNGCMFGASHIGNRPEMISMLDLAAKQNIKSWIEKVPISKEGCAKVVSNVAENKVHYRFVLTDYDKEFGKRTE